MENYILDTLPTISKELLCDILTIFEDMGVEEEKDLGLITENDLKPTLKTIQARHLIAAWKTLGL